MSGNETERTPMPANPLDQRITVDQGKPIDLPWHKTDKYSLTCNPNSTVEVRIRDKGGWPLHYIITIPSDAGKPAKIELDRQKYRDEAINQEDLPGAVLQGGTVRYTGNGRPPIRTIRITAGRPMRVASVDYTLTKGVVNGTETLTLESPDSSALLEFMLIANAQKFKLRAGERAECDSHGTIKITAVNASIPLDRQ
jgi:hypothetical protein